MKKNKLTLDKFRIAKLNNSSKIIGGTGIDDGGETKLKMKCIEQSKKWVLAPVND